MATAKTTQQTAVSQGRILVTEDDAGVRRLLRTLFEGEGFEVREARSGREMTAALQSGDISLVTLDLGLAGEDGLALARDTRRNSDVPIIMVTAKADEIDRIVGLEIGADDYISKPFNTREVLARVRAVLRRSRSAAASDRPGPACFAFGNWVFDVGQRVLRSGDGVTVDLTSREFAVLEALVRRSQRVMTRNMLIEFSGGGARDTLDRAIDTVISRLRRKIEQNPHAPEVIKTVRGGGYVFTAKVTPC